LERRGRGKKRGTVKGRRKFREEGGGMEKERERERERERR
jgi:hypothetical protein